MAMSKFKSKVQCSVKDMIDEILCIVTITTVKYIAFFFFFFFFLCGNAHPIDRRPD